MTQDDILHNAIYKFEAITSLELKLIQPSNKKSNSILSVENHKKQLVVEIKRNVHKSSLNSVLKQLEHYNNSCRHPLLVAESISQDAREILKSKDYNYLDAAGNCYINIEPEFYLFIKGQKKTLTTTTNKNQAFNKNGIKLIYALLLNKLLINQTYDTMSEVANISKSTIGYILESLKEKGFIIQINNKYRKIINKKELLSSWVDAYNEKLKPSLLRGKFSMKNETEWKDKYMGQFAYWGGEQAGNLFTHLLHPEKWTLYSSMSQPKLINEMKIYPDPTKGNLEIYDIFWNTEKYDIVMATNNKTVHPLIAYADLIGTKSSRNFEIANKIYEKYLQAYIVE